MKFFRVPYLHFAGSMADGRQCSLGDFYCLWVGIDEVDPVMDLLTGIDSVQNIHFQPEVLACASLGRPHLRVDDLNPVVTGGE